MDEVVAANTLLLEPTVRPTEYAPRTREGLYVFRFFEVDHKDVDEIAAVLARARAERHIALVLVEQNLDFAARLAETAHVMVKGELVATVATAELAADRDLPRRYMAI